MSTQPMGRRENVLPNMLPFPFANTLYPRKFLYTPCITFCSHSITFQIFFLQNSKAIHFVNIDDQNYYHHGSLG